MFLEQGIEDAWLVSPRFTAADLNLTLVFDRMNMLGLLERYLVASKRPRLCNYHKRLGDVEAVKHLRKEASRAIPLVIRRTLVNKLKQYTPYGLSVLALAGAVIVGTNFMMNK